MDRREAIVRRGEARRGFQPYWLRWQLDELFGLSKKVHGFEMRPDHVVRARETFVEA